MTSNVSYAALAKSLSDGKSPKETPVESQTSSAKIAESKDTKDTKETKDPRTPRTSRKPRKPSPRNLNHHRHLLLHLNQLLHHLTPQLPILLPPPTHQRHHPLKYLWHQHQSLLLQYGARYLTILRR